VGVDPVPAATVMLLRDGPAGLEVFMVERHREVDFVAGALVFPGGKVEASDMDPRLAPRCPGSYGLDPAGLTLRVAAIRETFEECGVLLAREPGASELLAAGRLLAIEERHRAALAAGSIGLAEIAVEEDLELATEALVPFAHWITPEAMPKRFDTHFFLAAAPAHQLAAHDGGESVDSVWTTPAAALEAGRERRRSIIFPTLLNLRKLGRSASVAEALAAARRARIVTVLPRLEAGPDGPRVHIPPEAGYGDVPQ
jgi:8-oxo-dGTP pyrophosphatase MutT (NUDIX family)